MGVRVEGLKPMIRDLQQLGLEVDDLKDAFSAVAREAAAVLASHVPRLTGRLASSARGNRAKSKAVVTIGRATLPYAGPINYGWASRNIEPAGFVEATDREMAPRAVQRLQDEISKQIRRRGLA